VTDAIAAARDAGPRRFEPPTTELTEPFWEATRRHVFLLQWCTECEQPIFYPREACPLCLGTSIEWRPASGEGRVYAVSVQHRPPMPLPFYSEGPYAVALVDLAEGVRVMSNVVGCPPEEVVVGMPVALTWEPLSDGRNLPQFAPS
jgi:uncharacterized OB-fold protein